MANEEAKKSASSENKPVEKQTNCLGCNKPLRKIKSYYRNGKFYCSKKCWLKTRKSKQNTEEKK